MESDNAMFMNIQDLVQHEMNKVKLIDILVYLNCLEVRLYVYIILCIYYTVFSIGISQFLLVLERFVLC